MKLADEDIRVLKVLGPVGEDGAGEGMFNYWYSEFGEDWDKTLRTLQSLKRRKLVAQEGRGKWAQFWITKAGAEKRAVRNE